MLYQILKPFAIFLFRLFFKLEVYGRENIPRKGGFILASNHESYLDPIVLGVASKRRLNFMAKEELFYNPLFSLLIRTLGAFPVKRDSADISALKEAMKRLKQGKVLVLFPEGSRRMERKTDSAYPGIGFLVRKLNIGVLPVFISGTEKALPVDSKSIKFTKIKVCFGKIIHYEPFLTAQEIAMDIMKNVRSLGNR